MNIDLCMILVAIVLNVWVILMVCGAAHAMWLELLNPRLRYANNEKRRLQDLNMEKTRNIL